MKYMVFYISFLVGLLVPFIFWKMKPWIKWLPAYIFGLFALLWLLRAKLSNGQDFSDIAYIIFFLMFGLASIGAFLGGATVLLIKKYNRKT